MRPPPADQDSELRLQNVLTLQAFSGGGFEDVNARFMRDVVGQGMQELTEALREHSSWCGCGAGGAARSCSLASFSCSSSSQQRTAR